MVSNSQPTSCAVFVPCTMTSGACRLNPTKRPPSIYERMMCICKSQSRLRLQGSPPWTTPRSAWPADLVSIFPSASRSRRPLELDTDEPRHTDNIMMWAKSWFAAVIWLRRAHFEVQWRDSIFHQTRIMIFPIVLLKMSVVPFSLIRHLKVQNGETTASENR